MFFEDISFYQSAVLLSYSRHRKGPNGKAIERLERMIQNQMIHDFSISRSSENQNKKSEKKEEKEIKEKKELKEREVIRNWRGVMYLSSHLLPFHLLHFILALMIGVGLTYVMCGLFVRLFLSLKLTNKNSKSEIF